MIAKIGKGQNVNGLVSYLFGPGRHEEHTGQRVVAGSAWDLDVIAPQQRPDGRFDTTGLSRWMDAYNQLGQAQGRPPAKVWHCSLSLPSKGQPLTDSHWKEAAETLMNRLGLDGPDAPGGGVRWIAVHHGQSSNGNDHIHISAVLADAQGTPRVPWNDYRTARAVCQELEARWGLTPTATADQTAATAATRGEQERAVREEREVPMRVRLESEVRAAAAVSGSFGEMQGILARRGIMAAEVHKAADGTAFGVTFTDPTYVDRHGTPIRYSGKALAPDLTLPKLQARWAGMDGAVPSLDEAVSMLDRAADQIAAGGPDAADLTWSVADHLSVTARLLEPDQLDGPLHEAARHAARAGRELHAGVPAPSPMGTAVRMSAVGVWGARSSVRDRRSREDLRLILASQRLMAATAELRRAQHRGHQAAAAAVSRDRLAAVGAHTEPPPASASAAQAPTVAHPPPAHRAGAAPSRDRRRRGPHQGTGRGR